MELMEEKVGVLKEMFPDLSRAQIFEHLNSSGGQVDSAIESILASTIDEVGEPLRKVEGSDDDDDSDEDDDPSFRDVSLRSTTFVPQSNYVTTKAAIMNTLLEGFTDDPTTQYEEPSSPSSTSTTTSNTHSISISSSPDDSCKIPTNTIDIQNNFDYLYAGMKESNQL